MTPFVKPLTWRQIIFTYLIPIIPSLLCLGRSSFFAKNVYTQRFRPFARRIRLGELYLV